MDNTWLGGAINGMAQQFGSLPSISGVDLPTLEPPRRFEPIPTITGQDPYASEAMTMRPPEPVPQIAMPEYTDPATGATGTYSRPDTLFDPATLAPVGLYDQGLNLPASGFGAGGGVSAMGGEWAALDALNPAITQAALQTGVPPNLIKAMLAREGGFGHDKWVAPMRGEHVYAFNGIFESTANSYGIDFQRMVNDDAYAVLAMGRVMAGIKANNPELQSWDDVAKFYFAGPNYKNDGWGDETGQNTVNNYAYGPSGVITRWKALDQAGGYDGTTGFGRGTFGGSLSWDQVVPGGAVYDWGEFGGESSNGLYGYGTQYGLNGTQHTGADVVTPRGSTYYAPMGGTITCAGTGIGSGADGGGCAAFGDTGGGAGRVELLLDNGAVLIFGHSAESIFRPGQRVNAGQAIGRSGTMNSDHIHLEARVRDPSMPSGWRIVDPRTVLGGGGIGIPGSMAGGGSWAQNVGALDWSRILPRPQSGW